MRVMIISCLFFVVDFFFFFFFFIIITSFDLLSIRPFTLPLSPRYCLLLFLLSAILSPKHVSTFPFFLVFYCRMYARAYASQQMSGCEYECSSTFFYHTLAFRKEFRSLSPFFYLPNANSFRGCSEHLTETYCPIQCVCIGIGWREAPDEESSN